MKNTMIDVAFNSKTKKFGTLVGAPVGPHIVPFRSMSVSQRFQAMRVLFPLPPALASYIESSDSPACADLAVLWKQIVAGKTPCNPMMVDVLITQIKMEYNVAANRGCDHYIAEV